MSAVVRRMLDRPMRLGAAVLVAGTLTLAMTSCTFITPQQAQKSYSPSDGVNASAGSVDIRNALLITLDGVNASLSATLINTGSTASSLQLSYTTTAGQVTKTVQVPANDSLQIRAGSINQVTLRKLSAPAGSLFPISFLNGTSGTPVSVQVPVLDNTLPGYATLTPPPTPIATPTPTPTDTATPLATVSPTPTPTP